MVAESGWMWVWGECEGGRSEEEGEATQEAGSGVGGQGGDSAASPCLLVPPRPHPGGSQPKPGQILTGQCSTVEIAMRRTYVTTYLTFKCDWTPLLRKRPRKARRTRLRATSEARRKGRSRAHSVRPGSLSSSAPVLLCVSIGNLRALCVS